jgi:hypothetical protein
MADPIQEARLRSAVMLQNDQRAQQLAQALVLMLERWPAEIAAPALLLASVARSKQLGITARMFRNNADRCWQSVEVSPASSVALPSTLLE